jgi:hypothetical protein
MNELGKKPDRLKEREEEKMCMYVCVIICTVLNQRKERKIQHSKLHYKRIERNDKWLIKKDSFQQLFLYKLIDQFPENEGLPNLDLLRLFIQ